MAAQRGRPKPVQCVSLFPFRHRLTQCGPNLVSSIHTFGPIAHSMHRCGLYSKLHGAPRPIELKSSVIKKRSRTGVPPGGISKKVAAAAARAGSVHHIQLTPAKSMSPATRPGPIAVPPVFMAEALSAPPSLSSTPSAESPGIFAAPDGRSPTPGSATSESEGEDYLRAPFPGPYHPTHIFGFARKRKAETDVQPPLSMGKRVRQ